MIPRPKKRRKRESNDNDPHPATFIAYLPAAAIQMYTLRDIFRNNVPLWLQLTRNFGFAEVELAGPGAAG
jgi:hypothetical protein